MEHRPEPEHDCAQDEADQRPGERHDDHLSVRELRGRFLVVGGREPAQQKESDRRLHSVPSKRHGVAEFVQEQRNKAQCNPLCQGDAPEA